FVADVHTTRGHRPAATWAARILGKVGEEAGIIVNDSGKYASCHDLRRTALQNWLDAGQDSETIQFLARHASFATTQKYYVENKADIIAERFRQVQSRYNGS
ncbi:MAG: tyrosine-type recombinase/integrase, partial [Pirellulaceae bacterium]|nr:tyrosine-type recombinase/integrase [Pirellulaceae bacterium]